MVSMKGNVIVGQSGGPTAVINSSLAGVYKTAKDRGARKVYGMLHGIQGLLEEKYVDLSEHIKSDLDIDLLKRTPSAYLGSCRYKLPESRAIRIFMIAFLKFWTSWKSSISSILVEMIPWIPSRNYRITLF